MRCRRSASSPRRNVRIGRLVELEVEDAAELEEMCEQLLANPLIEDYEVLLEIAEACEVRGVRFPGSCDEVDALLACERVADAELLWHGDRDLRGVDAVVVPGGLQLRRLPARAARSRTSRP